MLPRPGRRGIQSAAPLDSEWSEDHELTVKLPSEFPPGEAELIVLAGVPVTSTARNRFRFGSTRCFGAPRPNGVVLAVLLAACGGRSIEDRRATGTVIVDAGSPDPDAGGGMGPEVSEPAGNEDVVTNLDLLSLEASCVPPIAADPLRVFYGIQYSNHLDVRVSVRIVESRIVVGEDDAELVWSFAVDQIGPVLEPEGTIGAIVSQGYNKRGGSGTGMGRGELCDYCDAPARLEVVLTAHGDTLLLTSGEGVYGNPMHLGCAFE